MAGAIIGEAALSFLGLGVQPPTPSWGTMLNGGRAHLLDAPHLTMFPGLAIALLVLGFNFLGDGLRDSDRSRSARRRSGQRIIWPNRVIGRDRRRTARSMTERDAAFKSADDAIDRV